MLQIIRAVGKDNLKKKLVELKAIIEQNEDANLAWFIHQILITKVKSFSANVYNVFVDLLKELYISKVYILIFQQSSEIYKKCCHIDEEKFHDKMKVKSSAFPVRKYLM
jgi:hypothetical protein